MTYEKGEEFHVVQLFCGEAIENDTGEKTFSPLVLFAISGATNTGINNPNMYVVCAEMPLSLEDCVQKQGRAGRRPGSNDTTDLYTI